MQPLPCPFCGHEPETGPKNPERDGDGWGFVMCVNHDCPVEAGVRAYDGDPDNTTEHIKAAVKRWNTRC